jgi:hypothetical protein
MESPLFISLQTDSLSVTCKPAKIFTRPSNAGGTSGIVGPTMATFLPEEISRILFMVLLTIVVPVIMRKIAFKI